MSEHHETFDRMKKAESSSDRSFGITIGVFFIVVTLLPLLSGGKARLWALIPSGAFFLVSLLWPSLLSLLNKGWAKLGLILHWLISPVVLAFMFYLILTPFAFLMRLLRKDALNVSYEPSAESYWIVQQSTDTTQRSMINQF